MLHKILNGLIAMVWVINGLFCKVLNWVPRHQQIVAKILHTEQARPLTITIGILEILMAVWVVSGIRQRFCAIAQIVIILTMNILEFLLAPDLLLFGRLNLMVAIFFCGLIFVNEFFLKKKANY
jgi:hypothetical protein